MDIHYFLKKTFNKIKSFLINFNIKIIIFNKKQRKTRA